MLQIGCEIPHTSDIEEITFCNNYDSYHERLIICPDTNLTTITLDSLSEKHSYQIWFLNALAHTMTENNNTSILEISDFFITDGGLSYFIFTTLNKGQTFLKLDSGDINISLYIY